MGKIFLLILWLISALHLSVLHLKCLEYQTSPVGFKTCMWLLKVSLFKQRSVEFLFVPMDISGDNFCMADKHYYNTFRDFSNHCFSINRFSQHCSRESSFLPKCGWMHCLWPNFVASRRAVTQHRSIVFSRIVAKWQLFGIHWAYRLQRTMWQHRESLCGCLDDFLKMYNPL